MSDKKDRRKKKGSNKEVKEESEPDNNNELSNNASSNMITFNPNQDVILKLGQIVHLKNVISDIIDTHPECKWSSNDILKIGTWLEQLNSYIREYAFENNNNNNDNDNDDD